MKIILRGIESCVFPALNMTTAQAVFSTQFPIASKKCAATIRDGNIHEDFYIDLLAWQEISRVILWSQIRRLRKHALSGIHLETSVTSDPLILLEFVWSIMD